MSATEVFKDECWAGLAARLLGVATGPAPVNVLVVDDDEAFAGLLTLSLEMSGRFTVVGYAPDGRRAIEQAAWLKPDVVLMDVQMPVMDGIDATPRVLAAAPRAKVVVVSSSQSADDRRRARQAGAIAFLGKRTVAVELVRELERVLFRVVPLTPRHARANSADRASMH